MDQKIPFTSYDFWAYLSAGFLLLVAIDYVSETNVLSRSTWTVIQAGVAIIFAYAVGHLIAGASAVILERLLVGKVLGYPRINLFGSKKPGWLKALMPEYFRPLPSELSEKVQAKARILGIEKPGEAMFWAAFSRGKADPPVMARLDNFLNLYGFCRNIALVGLLDAILFYAYYRYGAGTTTALYLSYASLVAFVGMSLRYIKFYRLYALEVFSSYAFSKDDSDGRKVS